MLHWIKNFILVSTVLSANFSSASAETEVEEWTCDIKADSCQFPSEEYHNRCVNDKVICSGSGSGEAEICKGMTFEPDNHFFCNPKMEGHPEIEDSRPWAKCDINTCFKGEGMWKVEYRFPKNLYSM